MKELKSDEFNKIIARKKPVVIDFYTDWCYPCRYLYPILKKLENEYNDKVEFYKVNVDKNRDLATKYRIFSIPTVLIFYNKEVIGGFIGAMPERDVKNEIERSLKKVL